MRLKKLKNEGISDDDDSDSDESPKQSNNVNNPEETMASMHVKDEISVLTNNHVDQYTKPKKKELVIEPPEKNALTIKKIKLIKDDLNYIPEGVDLKNLVVWSWNINGIRAIIKKNRI